MGKHGLAEDGLEMTDDKLPLLGVLGEYLTELRDVRNGERAVESAGVESEERRDRANIKKRRQRYMADIFTTLVDIKWRWNLLNFVPAFMLSWLIFALLWWLICFSHGDFEHYEPPPAQATKRKGKEWKPCVEEVRIVVLVVVVAWPLLFPPLPFSLFLLPLLRSMPP